MNCYNKILFYLINYHSFICLENLISFKYIKHFYLFSYYF